MKFAIVHVPRTSGSSTTKYLKDIIGSNKFSSSINLYDNPVSKHNLRNYDYISGHISWEDVKNFIGEYKLITLFRDPLHRCVSWKIFSRIWHNDVKQFNLNCSFYDFVNSNHFENILYSRNTSTWQLGYRVEVNKRTISEDECLKRAKDNLHKFDFIGFKETINSDIHKLTKLLNIKTDKKMIHICHAPGSVVSDVAKLTKDEISEFNKVNWMDIELYNYAKELAKKTM